MTITPLRDRILVEPLNGAQTTKSGIIIPETAKEKPVQGRVLRVGGGRVTDTGATVALAVKEGDTVLYAKHAGQEVKVDDVEYILLTEGDVLGVINN